VPKDLTPKQKRFCEEYIKDCNATQSYIRAGYRGNETTARIEGCKLLAKPNIQAYLQRLQRARSSRVEIDADRVLKEYARIAFSNVTDVLSFDGGGVTIKDSKDLSQDVTAALDSIECVTIDSEASSRTAVKVKMHSKIVALGAIAKLIGMDKEAMIKGVIAMGYDVSDPRTGEKVEIGNGDGDED